MQGVDAYDMRRWSNVEGNYQLADVIRKELESNGVIIEDKDEQTIWKYK